MELPISSKCLFSVLVKPIYIFPPFSIFGRVLAKLSQDRVTALVIVFAIGKHICWLCIAVVPTICLAGETRMQHTSTTMAGILQQVATESPPHAVTNQL